MLMNEVMTNRSTKSLDGILSISQNGAYATDPKIPNISDVSIRQSMIWLFPILKPVIPYLKIHLYERRVKSPSSNRKQNQKFMRFFVPDHPVHRLLVMHRYAPDNDKVVEDLRMGIMNAMFYVIGELNQDYQYEWPDSGGLLVNVELSSDTDLKFVGNIE